MQLVDTHTHLYLEAFDNDRSQVIERAIESGIDRLLLPHIDSRTTEQLMDMCQRWPKNCFPMMGIHPCSVKEDFEKELEMAENWLTKKKFYAIGETGLDLYWDKNFLEQQKISLERHITWAKAYKLPLVIHAREAFDEIFEVLEPHVGVDLQGVFHCFTGNKEQAQQITTWGFHLGIGGVLTFNNSQLKNFLASISLDKIILETDSPYLAPSPHRSKRNESAFMTYVNKKLAEIFQITEVEAAHTTTRNALNLFKIHE